MNHFHNYLFTQEKNIIMKRNILFIALFIAIILVPSFSKAQEEIIIIEKFKDNAPKRFNAPKTPNFTILSKNQKYAMGLGGYVKGTISMDFNGAINNAAYFTTSAIPINPLPGNDKLLQYNVNQSSLSYNFISLSDKKTKFGAYINMNFSGENYSPYIEDAYITYGGLLLGRTTSLFTDDAAIPPTIDSEGPNGLTYKTNTVINYSSNWGERKRFSTGIGLEMPSTDFSVSENQSVTNQYIPDIPSYIQYSWGNKNNSHIRLSSIIRNVNYRNNIKDKNNIISTYACQLSGLINIKEKIVFYYQLTYGTGITTYIQDLNGLKLDFLPQHFENSQDKDAGKLEHVTSMAYYAGLQYNFNQRTFMSCTFSQVDVDVPDNYNNRSLYKEGYYLATNFFWYAMPNVQLGAEYLYGKHVEQNDEWGQANRLQVMLQYNF